MTSLPWPSQPSPLPPPCDSGLLSSSCVGVQTFHIDMDKGQPLAWEHSPGTQNQEEQFTVFSPGLLLGKISQLINQWALQLNITIVCAPNSKKCNSLLSLPALLSLLSHLPLKHTIHVKCSHVHALKANSSHPHSHRIDYKSSQQPPKLTQKRYLHLCKEQI